ncbi:30S ribosomal protein S21 [Candidatus Woesebacteria bacterium]|nr:30S ribosomal protein S21 [Candidatus Woesebacteria bacterium]
MPIIIKAKAGDSTNDLIKKFKKAVVNSDIVQKARDRKYYVKPSQERAVKKTEKRRLRKRSRSLKKMKNISQTALQRISERLSK